MTYIIVQGAGAYMERGSALPAPRRCQLPDMPHPDAEALMSLAGDRCGRAELPVRLCSVGDTLG